MNKVITINLGGFAFQLEDAGYDALRAYLDTARARLQGNPDRDEILSDIEAAIGEKFRATLNAHKNVVLESEVQQVLTQMGQIQEQGAEAKGGGSSATEASRPGASQAGADEAESAGTSAGTAPRRLYRVHEGAMLGGVCNGIAAYFGIDPTFVRLAFVLLTFMWGAGAVAYLVMVFVVPSALTAGERAAAHGEPATAQEFIRRARAGYYEAMKTFPDRRARREWKRKFRHEMRTWRSNVHREMAGGAADWRRQWQEHAAAHPGAAMGLPIVSLLHGVILIAWFSALISLLATGALFGIALPVGVPLWVAVLVVFFCYGMVVWPLKAARRAFYYSAAGPGGPGCGLFFAIDALVWVVIVAAMAWLALHHLPQAQDALHNLPNVVHDGVDAVRDWWHRRA